MKKVFSCQINVLDEVAMRFFFSLVLRFVDGCHFYSSYHGRYFKRNKATYPFYVEIPRKRDGAISIARLDEWEVRAE